MKSQSLELLAMILLFSCYPEEVFIEPQGKIRQVLTKIEDPYGIAGYSEITNFYYNGEEQLVKTISKQDGEIAREVYMEYLDNGLLKRKEIHDFTPPPVKTIYLYEYNSEGKLQKEVQEDEGVKYFYYDKQSLLWNVKFYPVEGTGLYDIHYEYDSLNKNLKYETMYLGQLWEGKQNIYYKYEYNYINSEQLKSKTLLQGNPVQPLPRVEVEYFYDANKLKMEVHYKVDFA